MPSERAARRVLARRDEMENSLRTVAGEAFENRVLRESFANVVQDLLRFEDENWLKIFGSADENTKGFTLDDVKKTTTYLEKQTKILGDLLGRGLRLKNNHAFGRGFTFDPNDGKSKIPPRFVTIMEAPQNKESVFSPSAIKELNRVIYTSGNLFLLYDRTEREWTRLAVDINIANYISYDNNPGRVKYYLRQWATRNDLSALGVTETTQEWVPTSSYDATPGRPKYPSYIETGGKRIPVNKNAVIVDRRYNRDNGEVWGVPDAFAAAAPAHIYATYMKDGAMLQHALAAISFVVKAKTEAAGHKAAAQIPRGHVGRTAITGPETEIQSLPRAGSINLYEGRPLVARVAAALDVSTTGLTSDPGPGGSYASENALSAPEQMAALSRQEDFVSLYAEIFRVMGIEAKLNFKRLDVDPIHRQMQSIGLARTLGFIHQAEGRNRSLELLDIEPTSTAMPEPDEFTGSKYSTLAEQVDAGHDLAVDQAKKDAEQNPIPSQGNSGAVGSLDDANSSRDSDRDSGTA
ncbi:portal protein [Microbacterium Phage DejaVu]|nr:portal protein [Microbacterium Phage DejaVu]